MITSKQKNEREKVLTGAHHDHERGMNSYAFFKTHNRATGQDLVQDTFVKTWAYLIRGGKIDLMKPFLYHILNHLIIDEYRKHKTSSLDGLLEKGFEYGFDNSERIFNVFDGKAALLLIKYLPAKYEKVIRMRYVQDLSLKEISLITGQSRNAVAVQAHRGLIKLRKFYNRI
jgi:RNA polymerase sigma-70 factor (ECF subfamily)